MPTPSIQTLVTDAQQVLNLDSISAIRSVVAVALANANTGTPLNPNLTTQQLWDQFYQVVTKPKSDIESIIANQLMKFLYSPPAPGGVGADKQVIFNDGGVLAGDADFIWNKTLNLLTVTGSTNITADLTVDGGTLKVDSTNNWVGINKSPTVALDVSGAATITGDLTVDTSTLKVDSANNRVGIGTATPGAGYSLDILGAAVGGLRVSSNNYPNLVIDSANSNGALIYIQEGGTTQARIGHLTAVTGLEFSGNNGTAATNVHYAIDSTGISTWKNVGGVAGTAMTLNATGLGVGQSPTTNCKLSVNGGVFLDRGATGGASQLLAVLAASSGGNFGQISNTGTRWALGYGPTLTTVGTEALIWDSSGNVGIGVAPSAWNSSYKGFQIGSATAVSSVNLEALFSSNYFRSATQDQYIANGFATLYRQASGIHYWYNAPSGTAGNAITFTQAMTLDASGNLLVGTTTAEQKLTVFGSASINGGVLGQGALISRDGSSGGANYGSNTGNTSLNAPASGTIRFNVNNGTFAGQFDTSGNLIWSPSATPPTLTTNGQLTVNATSNTNLRFSFRGSDGVTRVANLTLA